ncbi:hypothetical protein ACJJI3_01900 [Microbulbifer sp. ZKSA004]|uniref:hypothetical protein n=1 Tax=Microbulbifer sp. ZKSA004 TaxID=3243389 RepID=UPI004039A39F
MSCTETEMKDQHSRFVVPGQDPSRPVEDGNIYKVYDPRIDIRLADSGYRWKFYAGKVLTSVSEDGLSITNTTLAGHVLYDGEINRQLYRAESGAWHVRTTGYGNNLIPFTDDVNIWQDEKIF